MPIKTPLALVAVAAVAALGGATAAERLSPADPSSRPRAAIPPAPAPAARPVADDTTAARRVYDGAKASIAFIATRGAQGEGAGSGFVVSEDGLIVTNAHVVDGAAQIGVKLGTDGEFAPAQLVAADVSNDLALLKTDATGLRPLPFGDAAAVGDSTFAIGSPFGLDQTLTTGIVSALDRQITAPNGATITGVIQTDAAINPGNSGGPLLDRDGRVLGVNSQIASAGGGNVGIGFAVPAATVQRFLDRAADGDAPDVPPADAAGADGDAPSPDAAPSEHPLAELFS